MQKHINWNYVSMQSVVTFNPLFTISAIQQLKGEETVWVHALALFMTAVVWPKAVLEKSWSSCHLAEYRATPPLKNSTIDVEKKEVTSLPLLLREIARNLGVTYSEIGLCFLSLVPLNPVYESSMWKTNTHSEAWRSWGKQELCTWYACLGFHLLSFFPVFIFGCSHYILKDTVKSVFFDS